MATCTELYINTLGGLDLDGSTDKNLPYFVVENLATLCAILATGCRQLSDAHGEHRLGLMESSATTRYSSVRQSRVSLRTISVCLFVSPSPFAALPRPRVRASDVRVCGPLSSALICNVAVNLPTAHGLL